MLSHLSFAVTDLARSAAFYDAALGAIGFERAWTSDSAVGYGLPGGDDRFAIKRVVGPVTPPRRGFHLAFWAPDHAAVHSFHRAALAFGGRDAGLPGPRPQYGPSYYAAFVFDPDGYRIEAKSRS